ncbi:uncharacterized protein LOC143856055 [Tasmannia lanceolata]|uniref:uncharacterized protein LOC143856055 n=1 Tax=Tasmannia lanceolata TaxID=3420 RepID=UPI00406476D2
MAEKVSTLILDVDLDCRQCCKKVRRTLSNFCEIRSQNFDKKQKKVTISGPFDPKKLSKALYYKAGDSIKKIEIKEDKPKAADPPKKTDDKPKAADPPKKADDKDKPKEDPPKKAEDKPKSDPPKAISWAAEPVVGYPEPAHPLFQPYYYPSYPPYHQSHPPNYVSSSATCFSEEDPTNCTIM